MRRACEVTVLMVREDGANGPGSGAFSTGTMGAATCGLVGAICSTTFFAWFCGARILGVVSTFGGHWTAICGGYFDGPRRGRLGFGGFKRLIG